MASIRTLKNPTTGTALVPSYAGVRTGPFDAERSIYNLSSANMLTLRTWMGRARGSSQMLRLGFLGDSLTAGFLAGIGTGDPVSLLRGVLNAAGFVTGELVWIVNSGSDGLVDSRITLGGWTLTGITYANSATAGAQMTYTSLAVGTVVEILSTGQSGAFTYAIDGGSPVTVSPTGASMVLTKVTGLPNTAHTVVITATSTRAFIAAMGVNAGKGICLINASQCGSTAAQWLGTNAYSDLINALIAAQPSIVLAELGSNETAQSVSASTFQTNMQTIITKLKTASIAPFLTATMQYPLAPMWNVMYNLADSNGLPLLDMNDRIGTVPSDLKASDGQHFNPAGYSLKVAGWADMLQIPRPPSP